ncbi:MAG TPA: MFS transporter [Candidatus Nanopelagicaceae bacterium]|nr:MFS transporter [Candidatus Nanopelagicaceae bacterium]
MSENNKKISTSNMLSYGMADLLWLVFNGIFGGLFFIFWEVVVGLDILIITLAYTIFAVWNIINDPIVGYLVDRPRKFWSRLGKRYPWFIIGGIPAILFLAIIFSPPYLDPVDAAWIYFAWVLISLCLYELFYTISQLNHGALFPDKFRSDSNRRKGGFWRMLLGILGTAIGFIVPPLLIKTDNASSFASMAWIFVIVNLVIFVTSIPGHRESKELRDRYVKEQEKRESISFFHALKIVVTHKNFMAVIFVFLMDGIIGASLTASIQYVTKYILEEPESSAILILAPFILAVILSLFPWLLLSQKMKNNRKMLILGVFLNTIGLLPFMFAHTTIGFVIAALILGIGGGALRIGSNPVLADAIDEAVADSGKHIEGSFMGVYTFFIRFSLIAQGWIFAIAHTLTGFDANSATQSDLAKFGILLHTALIPMILTLIALVVFVLVYDLRPEKTKEIKEKLKEMNL